MAAVVRDCYITFVFKYLQCTKTKRISRIYYFNKINVLFVLFAMYFIKFPEKRFWYSCTSFLFDDIIIESAKKIVFFSSSDDHLLFKEATPNTKNIVSLFILIWKIIKCYYFSLKFFEGSVGLFFTATLPEMTALRCQITVGMRRVLHLGVPTLNKHRGNNISISNNNCK